MHAGVAFVVSKRTKEEMFSDCEESKQRIGKLKRIDKI